tara:strand:+ start:325 stop:489 length:165 start_codon:yes stop_codon:yes gene_type:complete
MFHLEIVSKEEYKNIIEVQTSKSRNILQITKILIKLHRVLSLSHEKDNKKRSNF